MKRLILCAAIAALVATGCSKKDEKSQETPKPNEGAPAVTCDKGQVAEGDKCVAVLTPEKVEAVKSQASKLDELQKKLDDVQVLVAPIELLDAIRQLDAWKTAAKRSDELATVDEMVAVLKQGTDQLKSFNQQLGQSKTKLTDLGNTLEGIYQGSGAARTLAAAKTQVSGELRAAIEPLQAQVVELMKAINPAFEELKKLDDIFDGVCAIGTLAGGGDDLKKLCETGKEQFEKAVTFLDEHKDAPQTLLTDTLGKLETELDTLVTAEARKLIDDAEQQMKKLVGEGADAEAGDDAGDDGDE